MDQTHPDTAHVVVVVTRTGGFGGLRRAWRAEPAGEEAPTFIALIERCPWDAADGGGIDGTAPAPEVARERGADRFMWSIEARFDEQDERAADLSDGALTGAWRDLVDAVRAWNAASSDVTARTGPSSSPA